MTPSAYQDPVRAFDSIPIEPWPNPVWKLKSIVSWNNLNAAPPKPWRTGSDWRDPEAPI